jgi:hypothetical protein
MTNNFFNAHHSPIGAFASFTLGFPGASGGLGLEIGKPADQSVFVGIETQEGGSFQALPFYAGAADDERRRYALDVGAAQADSQGAPVIAPFAATEICREFGLGTDRFTAGDLTFTIYSPVRPVPEPGKSPESKLRVTITPAVFVEMTVDNRKGKAPRRAYFGYTGSDPYSAMRRVDDTLPGYAGIGQGGCTAIVTNDVGAQSALAFSLNSILDNEIPDNLAFGLGGCAALVLHVEPGEMHTFQFAVCFYKSGHATAGMDTSYYYTRLFKSIEDVAAFSLEHFDEAKRVSLENDRSLVQSHLSAEQQFMLAHAVRSYYGSTELLEHNSEPIWVVNEGEYRMMNTFDLTADQVFYELNANPWTVRNELDLFKTRYSYNDNVRLPGNPAEFPGGISFTHDMGVANVFSRPQHSSYEQFGLTGCFSHMTHEQLVNWVCCGLAYIEHTADVVWRDENLDTFAACLQSLINRDHPNPAMRDGVMSLDSSRTKGGAEITTYDSLDTSLGQARNNIYLAVKTWASYVGLEKLFRQSSPELSAEAHLQAHRCADTLVKSATPGGTIPAVIGEGNDSKIIPVVEGLVFPFVSGSKEAVARDGEYGELITALRRHLEAVLKPGVCLFPDGGWKLSSSADNSWLSKIYLCQFVVRRILGMSGDHVTSNADKAHVAWLKDGRNAYWSWSDQIVAGIAQGSKYYPRGVTSILWLSE